MARPGPHAYADVEAHEYPPTIVPLPADTNCKPTNFNTPPSDRPAAGGACGCPAAHPFADSICAAAPRHLETVNPHRTSHQGSRLHHDVDCSCSAALPHTAASIAGTAGTATTSTRGAMQHIEQLSSNRCTAEGTLELPPEPARHASGSSSPKHASTSCMRLHMLPSLTTLPNPIPGARFSSPRSCPASDFSAAPSPAPRTRCRSPPVLSLTESLATMSAPARDSPVTPAPGSEAVCFGSPLPAPIAIVARAAPHHAADAAAAATTGADHEPPQQRPRQPSAALTRAHTHSTPSIPQLHDVGSGSLLTVTWHAGQRPRPALRPSAARRPSSGHSQDTRAASGTVTPSTGASALLPSASSKLLLSSMDSGGSGVVPVIAHSSQIGSLPVSVPATAGAASVSSSCSSGALSASAAASWLTFGSAASPRSPSVPRGRFRPPLRLGAALHGPWQRGDSNSSHAADYHHPWHAHCGGHEASFIDEYFDVDVESPGPRRGTAAAGTVFTHLPGSAFAADAAVAAGGNTIGGIYLPQPGLGGAPIGDCFDAHAPPHAACPGSDLLEARGRPIGALPRQRVIEPMHDMRTGRRQYQQLIRGDSGGGGCEPCTAALGLRRVNFQKYEFPLSRGFTFSDGSRIRVPGDADRLGGVP